MTFFLSILRSFYHLCPLQMNFINFSPKTTFSFMMEREPCKQLSVLQPSILCWSAFLSWLPGDTSLLPQTTQARGDRSVWVAAWQGCFYGNQSACEGAKSSRSAGAGPTPLRGRLMAPGGQPALPCPVHGPSWPILGSVLVLISHISLSANPIGSTFKR